MVNRLRRLAVFSLGLQMAFVWTLTGHATVWFTSPDLRTAAEEWVEFLNREGPNATSVNLATQETAFKDRDWVIANYVKNRNVAVKNGCSPAHRAFLEAEGQESYVAFSSNRVRYLVGGGNRGALFAVFRMEDAWKERRADPFTSEAVAFQETPYFRFRIAGAGGPHPVSDFAQPLPLDYDWDDYARSLVKYGVNLTPGVVGGQIVPDVALRKWDLGKVLFVSATPFSETDLRKWRASNPSDIKPSDNPRLQKTDLPAWSPCPETPFGRKAYTEWIEVLLEEHKTTKAIVFFFSDWGAIPGTECQPGAARWERVVSFLETLREIVQPISPEVKIFASSRGFSSEELSQIVAQASPGVGFYFEEPSPSFLDPPQSGFDPSLATAQLAPAFAEILQKTVETRSSDLVVAVSAGDSDWMVSPAVGIPLPRTTYTKIRRLAELGVKNVALAMGGLHPWVYSPSSEVFKEMIWNPQQECGGLLARIAKRDFREAGPDAIEAWGLFEKAFAEYAYVGRAQRLHEFTSVGKGLVTRPLRPSFLREDDWSRESHKLIPFLLESVPAVITSWQEGVSRLQKAQELVGDASLEVAGRLRDGVFWSSFYLRLLETQRNVVRCLNLMTWIPEGEDPEKPPWVQAFSPVYRDEMDNCQAWRDLLFTCPHRRLRVESEDTTPSAISRRFEQKQAALAAMLGE